MEEESWETHIGKVEVLAHNLQLFYNWRYKPRQVPGSKDLSEKSWR
jgi:hypothetical protein